METDHYFISGPNIRLSDLMSEQTQTPIAITEQTIPPGPEFTSIHPEPEFTSIHPEPEFTSIHPEPEFTSIHPGPEFTSIHPEDDPENKEYYIFRAPENPYYKFDDVCAEILAKDIRPKFKNLHEIEAYFEVHFNDVETEKYSEQILKIMNEGLDDSQTQLTEYYKIS
jgi:hypothetical protein